jgi:hypothetical protein
MQTFLPLRSFEESAKTLDYRRLGKQRVETLQIIKAVTNPEYGWQNHPAVRMWRGYVPALMSYQEAICSEWTDGKGYKDTCLEKSRVAAGRLGRIVYPPWLDNEALFASHRSNLIRKDEAWYRKFWPNDPSDLEYVWPVS